MIHSSASQAIAAKGSRNCAVGKPATPTAELLSPPAPAHGLPARCAGIREAEVLDGQCEAPTGLGGMNKGAGRVPDPGVPGRRRQAGHNQRDPQGCSDRVSGQVNNPGGKMTLVQVDAQNRADLGELPGRGDVLRFAGGPRSLQIPAAPARSNEIRYVTQRFAATRPAHTCCLWANSTGTFRLRRGPSCPTSAPGALTLKMPGRLDADGFVPEPFALLAVSGQEHPLMHPETLPLLDCQVCRLGVTTPTSPPLSMDR